MENNIFKDVPIIFLYFFKYFCDKYGVRGSRFSWFFGNSTNRSKSIAICPGVKISHLGIIKAPKKLYIYVKRPRKTKTHFIFLLYFWPLLDPVLGRCQERWRQPTSMGSVVCCSMRTKISWCLWRQVRSTWAPIGENGKTKLCVSFFHFLLFFMEHVFK